MPTPAGRRRPAGPGDAPALAALPVSLTHFCSGLSWRANQLGSLTVLIAAFIPIFVFPDARLPTPARVICL